MSLPSRCSQYEKALREWTIRSEMAKGSKGTVVYQIVCRDEDCEEVCALKAIPIICERGNYNSLSEHRKKEYQQALQDRKKYAISEVQTMTKVRGRTNIVDYFSHHVVEWEDNSGFGCDLLIRMELLQDLRSELNRGRIFREAEVIQIGKDICSALVICHRRDILHRDIKPENIFFNEDGDYKLGDFGIARILDKCPDSHASSGVGTVQYIAPEQATNRYDMRVDIYSLGLVLYELTNQNRLPFAKSSYVTPEEIEKRLHENKLPKPCKASDKLAEIILKACAHDPENRYQSAQEMLDALNQLNSQSPDMHHSRPVSDPGGAIEPPPAGNNYDTEYAEDTEAALPKLSDSTGRRDGFVIEDGVLVKYLGQNHDVVLPSSVTKIGDSAFEDCSRLTSVTIPGSVTSIGDSAFWGCSGLTSVDIPDSVTSIGSAAFFMCSGLTSVTIPDGITSIGSSAFSSCDHLTSIRVANENPKYVSVDGVLFSANQALLHTYPSGKEDASYCVPSSVTCIGDSAFWNCSRLARVVIPGGVTSIGDDAFVGCSGLTSVTIPASITSIGDHAFDGCNALKNIYYSGSKERWKQIEISEKENKSLIRVTTHYNATDSRREDFVIKKGVLVEYRGQDQDVILPSSVTKIGDSAFEDCSRLTSVSIPNSVTSIGDRAFKGCSGLTNVTIPNSVVSIGLLAFEDCSGLTSVTIPNSVTSIGSGVFSSCGYLTSIHVANGNPEYVSVDDVLLNADQTFLHTYPSGKRDVAYSVPSSVTCIGDLAFWNCNRLTSVTVPDSVTSVGLAAFRGCSGLTSLIIPNGVTSISFGMFAGCSRLTSVSIPDSIISIRDDAFVACDALKNICYGGNEEQWKQIEISEKGNESLSSATIHYNAADSRRDDFVIKDGVLVKYRGQGQDVVLPSSVTRIGDSAFKDCVGLTSVVIPDNVVSIGDFAFYGCSGLTNVAVPNSVTSIGILAFVGCSRLTNAAIPDSVTSIGDSAFAGCGGLTSMTIPNSVTSIGRAAFADCSGLTNVVIPDNVISIGDSVFYGCGGLTSVTIPNSVTSVGISAFAGCDALKNIYYSGSKERWKQIGGSKLQISATIHYNVADSRTEAFVIEDGVLVKYCGQDHDVVLPSSVTRIGDSAFKDCAGLTCVTIPNSVTSIGDGAFVGCSGLTSVAIPNSVTSIGNHAFGACRGLTSMTIPNSVTSIGTFAFVSCSALTCVTIPYSVTSIGDSAFFMCSGLTSVTIPNTVTSVGSSVFGYCDHLTSINVATGNPKYVSVDGVLFNANRTLLHTYPSGKTDVSYRVPSSVTSIGVSAFSGCSGLTSMAIPNSVTSIGISAFDGCNALKNVYYNGSKEQWRKIEINEKGNESLASATIHYNATGSRRDDFIIENGVLVKYCGQDHDVVLPPSITRIGDSAFKGCVGLTSVTISNHVTAIGNSAFDGCSGLKNVTIPKKVTSIGYAAFWGCRGLTSVTITNSTTSIGDFVFAGCDALENIYYSGSEKQWKQIGGSKLRATIHYGATDKSSAVANQVSRQVDGSVNRRLDTLDDILQDLINIFTSGDAAEQNSAEDFIIKNGVLVKYCGQDKDVVLPPSVTRIGDSAFKGCAGLTSVTIPNSVTSIWFDAFLDCAALKNIYYSGSREQWKQIEIGENGNKSLFRATIHCGADGKSSAVANQASGRAGGSISRSGDFVIKDGVLVEYRGQDRDVVLPPSITRIGDSAFRDSDELTSVTIPNSVVSIGLAAFWGCGRLTNVSIPDSVTSIGKYAFSRCVGLTGVSIPNSVTSIGHAAFDGCSRLTIVAISDSVTSIGTSVFACCSRLTGVNIPDSVTSIGDNAFWGCKRLMDVIIPNSVTSIGVSAFDGCDALKNIFYGGSEEQWKQIGGNKLRHSATIHYNDANK